MYSDDMSGVINQQSSVSALLGISPGGARLSGYEGQTLPASTYGPADRAAYPWSPDSPVFWLVVVGGLTAFGILGASVRVTARAGHRAHASAGAEVNS